MGLPTLLKTWHFSPNILVSEASHTSMRRELMYQLVRRMVGNSASDWVVQSTGAPSSPSKFWTVVSMSDSTAVASAFNWTGLSSVVWGTEGSSPHSWGLLRLVDFFGSGDHLEWVISCAGTNTGGIGAFMTRNNGGTFTGFSGGTTSQRPTSAQEVQLRPNSGGTAAAAGWMGSDGSSELTRRFSVMASSDGQEWRVLFFTGGTCPAIWAAGELSEPPTQDDTGASGWDFPAHSIIYSVDNNADLLTPAVFSSGGGDNRWVIGELNTTQTLPAYLGTQSITSVPWTLRANAANAFDGSLPFMNIPVILDNDSVRGPATMGYLKDMWWGLGTPSVTSDSLPDDATIQFVYGAMMVFPWIGDGTPLNPTA